ncbi:hypothetical protein [Leptolyngbya sp. FACHB-261]|uniref:hypothetical protein n=1 Tax=Leptolyngbya sp. FACHB-261 TaxID=2692806 RepID=UPI001685738A|nr:hypothetical protein [Leptolyngbya sp. FACHB-261]MBD2101831.1 hypothetical protein [Leptolyngbya sp. FACHB-261]
MAPHEDQSLTGADASGNLGSKEEPQSVPPRSVGNYSDISQDLQDMKQELQQTRGELGTMRSDLKQTRQELEATRQAFNKIFEELKQLNEPQS